MLALSAGSAVGCLTDVTRPAALACALAAFSVWALPAASWLRGGAVVLAVACLAVGNAAAARDAVVRPPLAAWFAARGAADGVAMVEGRIASDASVAPDGGARLVVDVARVRDEAGWREAAGRVDVHVAGEAAARASAGWTEGRGVRLPASLRWPAVAFDPGAPSPRWQALVRRAALIGRVKSAALVDAAPARWWDEWAAAARGHVRRAIAGAVGPRDPLAAAIVTAIVIGDRAGLDPDLVRRLQDAGTYHLVAISGGNVALVVALVVVALRGMARSFRAASIATIVAVAAYGWMVGGDPSVDRAVAAALCYLAADLIGLIVAPIDVLALVLAALVIADPLTTVMPAAWLSFGATLALVVGAGWLSERLARIGPAAGWRARTWRLVSDLVASTFVAELVLFPIAVAAFERVTIAGLVLNLIAIPAMAIVEAGGWVIVIAGVVPGVAAVARWSVIWATRLYVSSAGWVAFAPWCTWRAPSPSLVWLVLFYACAACAWRLRPRRWRIAAAAGAGIALAIIGTAPGLESAAPPPGWLRVTALDVGQGDALVLQFPGGRSLLVDAGTTSASFDDGDRIVTPALWALGVRRLDWAAFTHPDLDHIGGVDAVARTFRPREIWEGVPVPPIPARAALHRDALARGEAWRQLRAGDRLEIGAVTVEVLNPPAPDWERQRTRNDDSVVLRVRYGDVEWLLTGDISANVESPQWRDESSPPLRVLKVAHHGSATSSSPAFVAAYRPALAIVSVGRDNRFGHPAPEVVARLQADGASVLRTDRDGAVIVETDGREIRARTWRGREWQVRLVSPPA